MTDKLDQWHTGTVRVVSNRHHLPYILTRPDVPSRQSISAKSNAWTPVKEYAKTQDLTLLTDPERCSACRHDPFPRATGES